MSGAAPTPVGGDGQLRGNRRQRIATAIAAIVVPGRSECEPCGKTRALLEDVASLSDQITLNVHDVRT